MDERLKLLERVKLQLLGYTYYGEEKKEEWKEPIPFYIFKCPTHGYVKNYVKGYEERLECPLCLEEKKLETEPPRLQSLETSELNQ